jgi:alkylation response protein AidB-like acyl-CoA dehydrogenase
MDMLARAREIAESVLFPATIAVDLSDRVPAAHLDLLAGDGFYGMAVREDVDFATGCAIVETFASACLCTTFVWLQHQGVVRSVAASDALRDTWLPRLVAGQVRAGVALGGTLPKPTLLARRVGDGYVLAGPSPWVTGWGMVDVLGVAARDGDSLVWLLVDAVESATLTVEPLRMAAVSASNTVTATFIEQPVPADRVIRVQDHADWAAADAAGQRLNGSLALGVASRCVTLLGPGPLDAELAGCRARLDAAPTGALPDARAAVSALAARAAVALVGATGSRSVLVTDHAQKLAREAMFLLVFGSRPAIRQALLPRLLGSVR